MRHLVEERQRAIERGVTSAVFGKLIRPDGSVQDIGPGPHQIAKTARPKSLSLEDLRALSPLLYSHVNRYGSSIST